MSGAAEGSAPGGAGRQALLRLLRGLGFAQMLSGLLGVLVLVLGSGLSLNLLSITVVAFLGALVYCGALLARGNWRIARWAAVLWLLQIVSISVKGFQYSFALPVQALVGWRVNEAGIFRFGVWWSSSPAIQLWIDPDLVGNSLQVNLVAALAIGLLWRADRAFRAAPGRVVS